MTAKTVSLFVYQFGKLAPYTGQALYGNLDFYAWRVGSGQLLCVAAFRLSTNRKVDEQAVFRELYYHLRQTEPIRATDIRVADGVSRRDIVQLFQGYNRPPVN